MQPGAIPLSMRNRVCDGAKPGLRRLIRAHLDTIHRVTPCLNRRSGLPAARGIKYIEMAQADERPVVGG